MAQTYKNVFRKIATGGTNSVKANIAMPFFQPVYAAPENIFFKPVPAIVQRKVPGNATPIQRQINYPEAKFEEKETIPAVLGGVRLALTTPTINNTVLPDDRNNAGDIILKAFGGPAMQHKDGKASCIYNEPEINISANISMIKPPGTAAGWSGNVDGSTVTGHDGTICRGKTGVPVDIKGDPNAKAVYDKMHANELEHYDDIKAFSKSYLEGLMTYLRSFKGNAASEAECGSSYVSYVNNKDITEINNFLTHLTKKVADRDKKPGPHDFKPQVHIAKDCARIDVDIKVPQ